MGQILTVKKLNNMYDDWFQAVLKDFIVRQTRQKGKLTSFEIVKELPAKEEYLKLKDIAYTFDASTLLTGAFEQVESLRDELQEWYDNLPEGFQNSSKGDNLMEQINGLENIDTPEIPDVLSEMNIVCYHYYNGSRSSRLNNVIHVMNTVKDHLENYIESLNDEEETEEIKDKIEELISSIEDAISNAECIEFPGMFS